MPEAAFVVSEGEIRSYRCSQERIFLSFVAIEGSAAVARICQVEGDVTLSLGHFEGHDIQSNFRHAIWNTDRWGEIT